MLLPRNATEVARSRLTTSPCLMIEGARQVGKSTLAKLLATPGAVIANLDRQATYDAASADPEGFVAQAGEDGQLVIDEVQRLPQLTLALKVAINEQRRPGRFIVTGSSNLLRVRGTADSLAGRAARVQLFGLSVGETERTRDDFAAHLRGTELSSLVASDSEFARGDYVDLIAAGSYPEARQLPPNSRHAWFDDYTQAILGRDLGALRREVDPRRAMAILRTLSGRQSGELVTDRLARDTTIPASTVTRYLDLLIDVGLIQTIGPWTTNLARREVGRRKVLVLDSGLATRLARVSEDQLRSFDHSESFGAFLEGFVAAELLRQQTWTTQKFELYHYRDRSGVDVDLVMEFDDGAVVGIEVKAASSFSRAQFSGLATLRDRVGERFIAGIVLNTSRAGYRFADRLVGAPISLLWRHG